jgi:twitching motility protein PilT
VPVPIAELPTLRAEDTAGIARDLIRDNETYLRALIDTGSIGSVVALARSLPLPRQRVPPARHFAIVMRMIAQKIPSIQELGLPPAIADCATLKNGIVLVTGPDRIGQVVDARGDHRSDQHRTAPITS